MVSYGTVLYLLHGTFRYFMIQYYFYDSKWYYMVLNCTVCWPSEGYLSYC